MEKLELFIKELEKISEKYGYHIWGCGCCESPAIYKDDLRVAENLRYNENEKLYSFETTYAMREVA